MISQPRSFDWHKVNLSTVFAGQKVGIKQIDDHIWLVSFMHYDLRYIDLEGACLQIIDTPFSARVSCPDAGRRTRVSPFMTRRRARRRRRCSTSAPA